MSHPRWTEKRVKSYRARHGRDPPVTERSVNAGVRRDENPIRFPRLWSVVDRILKLGRHTVLSGTDFADG